MKIVLPAVMAAFVMTTPNGPHAEVLRVEPVETTDWKAVYGKVEARDHIPARARLGGSLVALSVVEGDLVTQGQEIARIVDDKLAFQLAALSAQREALAAQLGNAETDLNRGEELLKNGSTTSQRVDALRTGVEVLRGQIAALDAQAEVITQQQKEGAVLAPVSGRVLDVPVAKGAVVLPGEAIAAIGGGGTYLRLAVPERYLADLEEGATIEMAEGDGTVTGTLSRIYPLIEAGRVIADVEIADLSDAYVGARLLVRLPVATRATLLVPESAIVTRGGLDFVAVVRGDDLDFRVVVPGQSHGEMIEIISGLKAGDQIETTPSTEAKSHD